jgi:wobble nucleotide-excising tRNase
MAMTQKTYKTAQGKTLDMGKLMLQNEKTRAVGNMKVNARGDEVDDMNNVIRSKPEQVNKQYNRQVTNPRKKS